jgi:hypothetical protein
MLAAGHMAPVAVQPMEVVTLQEPQHFLQAQLGMGPTAQPLLLLLLPLTLRTLWKYTLMVTFTLP